MYPFRRLTVWVKAHELTLRVYQATDGPIGRKFPGLAAQLRRAAASIPANLAEGTGHSTDPQFNRFIEIAQASAREADYHLLLARDLEAIPSRDYATLSEVRGMLFSLRKRVQERMRQNGKKSGRPGTPPPPATSNR